MLLALLMVAQASSVISMLMIAEASSVISMLMIAQASPGAVCDAGNDGRLEIKFRPKKLREDPEHGSSSRVDRRRGSQVNISSLNYATSCLLTCTPHKGQ